MKSKIGLVLDVDFKPFNPIDRSVYGHVLTNYGSQWNLNGRSLDGVDDYVDAGNSNSLDLSRFTLGAWVKPSTVSPQYQGIVCKGTMNIANYDWYLNYGEVRIQWNTGDWRIHVTSLANLVSGNWYYIVTTYDGSFVKIYVNGIEKYSASDASGLTTNTFSLRVGRSSGNDFYNGIIDEVRVWNRILFVSEVQQLYLEGKKKGRM